jgi:cytochrome c-type biogenesis protein CcmH/NrfF
VLGKIHEKQFGKSENEVIEFLVSNDLIRSSHKLKASFWSSRNEIDGFKELGAELYCVSCEGQQHAWFARALLIWSTSTSYDQKRVI